MNARFWDFVHVDGGPVKITLAPDQRIHWSYGRNHEEGWSRTTVEWEFDGKTVTCTTIEDGRDCDGRLTQESVCECPLHELHWRRPSAALRHDHPSYAGVRFPRWQKLSSRQRDEYAEAAGY